MYKITLLRTKPKYDCEQNMNIQDEIANNGDTTIQANSAAKGATSEDTRQVEPKYIASVSFTPARISQYLRRRRHHRGAESKQSTDPDKLCTNFYCKTRKTPMWRKGPLGPKVNSEYVTSIHVCMSVFFGNVCISDQTRFVICFLYRI